MSDGNGRMAQLAEKSPEELLETINNYDLTVEALQESLADAQLAAEDVGWRRLSWDGVDQLLTNDQIIEAIQLTRIAWLMNPLIHHAASVQANYVFGQGVSVRAKPGDDTNEVLQAWWDDPSNQRVLTSPLALWYREVQLWTEGNLFFVLFPNISTGQTIVRTIPPEEFIRGGIIFNPEDKEEPWFYHRVWSQRNFNPLTGQYAENYKTQEAYYPDMRYNPGFKVPFITTGTKQVPVLWDSPIYHVKVGNIAGQPFGVPEAYSALAWARAVKLDLEDYATLRRALSRFAWKLSTKGGKAGVAQAKLKLASTLTSGGKDTNPPPQAGSTFIQDEGRDMTPMRLAGATPSPEEGRRLWLMVSAGTGIPETILTGNADVGSLATARTLDRPTELQMKTRQTLWDTVLSDIGMYVLGRSAIAPSGALEGDLIDGVLELRTRVAAPSGRGRRAVREVGRVQVEVNFPPILERNKKENVDAVVDAVTLSGRKAKGLFPMAMIRQRLLEALQEPDVDGAIAAIEKALADDEDFPSDMGPENQQPSGEQVQNGPSTRERVTNNEFVDES